MGESPGLFIGVFGGSFMVVVVFAIVITFMARAKHRQRLMEGTAFAHIKKEESRFQGMIKRVAIMARRPQPEEIFAL